MKSSHLARIMRVYNRCACINVLALLLSSSLATTSTFVHASLVSEKNRRTQQQWQLWPPRASLEATDTYWSTRADEYQQVFMDDFDTLDTAVWNHEIGYGPGNGEVQYYTDLEENAFVKDSILHVRALRDREYQGEKYEWTSARLNTAGNFNFSLGRMSARVRCEPVHGPFSAVWALSEQVSDSDTGWPLCGEIDFFEMQTLWDYTPSTLHFQEHHYGQALSYFSYDAFETVQDWHVYGVEWSDTHIAFYHDGRRIGTYPAPIHNVTQVNWPFHSENPFYLIINNAMNPEWGSHADPDLVLHDMEVDWIKVEQKKTPY